MSIIHNGTLASFSVGRPTALIVDFGANQTRVVPVIDGFVIRQAIQYTKRGGNWMTNRVINTIEQSKNTPIKLWYENRYQMTKCTSFTEYHKNSIAEDIKRWMFLVPPSNNNNSKVASTSSASTSELTVINEARNYSISMMERMPPYELPDGQLVYPSQDLCFMPEHLFTNSQDLLASSSVDTSSSISSSNASTSATDSSIIVTNSSLQDLIYNAVSKCDVDSRKDLLGNICLVGGGSLMDGMQSRIVEELVPMLPPNIKVIIFS